MGNYNFLAILMARICLSAQSTLKGIAVILRERFLRFLTSLIFLVAPTVLPTAQASTLLDFTTLTPGYKGASVSLVDGDFTTTITNTSTFGSINDVLFESLAVGQPVFSICFISNLCLGDGEIVFSRAVTNLSFNITAVQGGDRVLISAFDSGNNVLGTIDTSTTVTDFSSFGEITRLVFDDVGPTGQLPNPSTGDFHSQGAGIGYNGFSFDITPVTAVPVPAAVWLFGSGLLGLVGVARRKKA